MPPLDRVARAIPGVLLEAWTLRVRGPGLLGVWGGAVFIPRCEVSGTRRLWLYCLWPLGGAPPGGSGRPFAGHVGRLWWPVD